jgi:hypothetical protein
MKLELTEKQKEKVREGIKIIKKYGWCYLNMDTRTGKTPVSLKICEELNKSVLFITKKGAIKSVLETKEDFGIDCELEVTNHEQSHKKQKDCNVLIIDEAHCIGGYPKAGVYQKNIAKIAKGKIVIFLSATFAPESYSTLYHQLTIPDKGLWKDFTNFYKWARSYVKIKHKKIAGGKFINDYSHADKKMIAQQISKYVVELTQDEAGIKIPVEENFETVEMSSYTKHLVRIILKNKVIPGTNSVWGDTAAKLKSKIHQLCTGTVITKKRNHFVLDYSKVIRISKFKFDKIVIFYKYKFELEMIKNIFPEMTDNPEEFQKKDRAIFAGQFRSKREGVRLDTADALFMLNIDYAYLSYKQTKDRLVSYVRKKPIYIYWLFSDIGIEKDIYNVILKKKDYNLYYFRRQWT